MKAFIVVLCFVAAANCQKGKKAEDLTGKGEMPAGCANPPKGTKLSDCCPNSLNYFSQDSMKNCSNSCKGKKDQEACCTTDCFLNAINVLQNGKFNAELAKDGLALLTSSHKAWTPKLMSGVVDGCFKSAPANLADFRSKAPSKFIPKCSEDTSLNMVIAQCIRRELFFQCPGMVTNASCKALVDYGKGCPMFPLLMGPPGKHGIGENAKDNHAKGAHATGDKPKEVKPEA